MATNSFDFHEILLDHKIQVCTRKRKYTRVQAIKRVRFNKKKEPTLNHYKCPYGNHYHMGKLKTPKQVHQIKVKLGIPREGKKK